MELNIILVVAPVFLVICLGFGIKKSGLVNAGFLYDLNRLIYYLALPLLLFYKIAKADFLANFNLKLLTVLIVTTLLGCLLSYALTRIKGYSASVAGAFCQGAFRGNLAYIGLAIVDSAFGETGFTIAGILLGFIVPLYNFLSVVVLSFFARKQGDIGTNSASIIKDVLGNPLIIASFLGIGWSYFGLSLPLVIERALDIVTRMSLPLALISIGASFSFKKLQGDIGTAFLATSIKLLGIPLMTGILLYIVGVRGQEFSIGLLLSGAPTATVAFIMAQQMKADAELSGTIIMLSTLCSMLTYSLMLHITQFMV